jgi:hypothetical protein
MARNTNRGHGYLFTEPGVYPVEERVAQRLLADIPQWFQLVQPASAPAKDPNPDKPEAPAEQVVEDEKNDVPPVDDKAPVENKGAETAPANEAPQEPETAPEDTKPALNLSKANRAQLEAVAGDMGLEVTDELDTNKKLAEAIKAKHDQGNT